MNKLFAFFLFICINTSLFSQQLVSVRDFETWWSLECKKKVFKNSELLLNQSARFNTNSSFLKDIITDLEFEYKANSFVKLGAVGRVNYDRSIYYLFKYRANYGAFVLFKLFSVNQSKCTYRILHIKEFDLGSTNYSTNWRHRLKYSYDIRDEFELYVSSEIFLSTLLYSNTQLKTIRSWLGIDYKNLNVSFALEYNKHKTYTSYNGIFETKYLIKF